MTFLTFLVNAILGLGGVNGPGWDPSNFEGEEDKGAGWDPNGNP